jgi:hypothetical protein
LKKKKERKNIRKNTSYFFRFLEMNFSFSIYYSKTYLQKKKKLKKKKKRNAKKKEKKKRKKEMGIWIKNGGLKQ